MAINTEQHNLARKWRSKNFDEIIGQELAVKILKNSLFRSHFFPVYLFAGQRGCGKTSTARIFAAAVNCQMLDEFRQNPKKTPLPCLTCDSCVALYSGRHPDFIEIDAASHTGVDNVRQIIDASSLLPLMGRKKIYLIDEAHMLSKAAFNAFLKLMEEPPASVLYILATTDPQKIIETVRSRCFQLFFKPISTDSLSRHLARICQEEQIVFADDALDLICKETDGSARDALNLLEQIRFSSAQVTKQTVQQVLGHLDDDRLLQLFTTVITSRTSELLNFIAAHNLAQHNAEFVWHKLISLARTSLWLSYGVTPEEFKQYHEQLKVIAMAIKPHRLVRLLETFYENELQFYKTTAQYTFLEMLLVQFCHKNEGSGSSGLPAQTAINLQEDEADLTDCEEDEFDENDSNVQDGDENAAGWNRFLHQINEVRDPVVQSIFKQAIFNSYDPKTAKLVITLSKKFSFFSDSIEAAKSSWQPILQKQFGLEVQMLTQFDHTINDVQIPKQVNVATTIPEPPKKNINSYPQSNNNPYENRFKQSSSKRYNNKVSSPFLSESKVDISDAAQWKFSHLLLEHFPGTVTYIKEHVAHE